MCVFHNESYINLLKLLIESISVKANINKNTTDILIITSPTFKSTIENELKAFDLPIEYFTLDLHTLMEASCCKLQIFSYNEINKYEKILYLDTDVLVNSDVNVLFDVNISSDKLYALEEGHIGNDFWGNMFFDFTKFNKYTSAFSAGVFYFINSSSIKQLFEDTNAHIANYMRNNSAPTCLDQPFLVYNSFIQNKYDNQMMKSYLQNNPGTVSRKKIIYHFPGGPGDYLSKYDKMVSFWKKMNYQLFLLNQVKNCINIVY
jgi:lipopolysaccharide biosynthesis glycosyltransferase